MKQLMNKSTPPLVNVNQAITNGTEKDSTPLIIASYVGHASCVEQLLLSDSIDCFALFDGKNAFDWAQPNVRSVGLEIEEEDISEKGRLEVVQLLIKAGMQ